MSNLSSDREWMRRAIALAMAGQGWVEPNPLVGCVIVDGPTGTQLLGEGYHQRFGGPHAECNALADARLRGHSSQLSGATAYVTLEPCCHHGKTPPCTDSLIAAGIGRVVTAQLDPFPQVSGRGVDSLRSAGIEVSVGVECEAAQHLNAPYLKRLRQLRPWVIAKWAMSLDGKIATHTGDSQWISNETSRQWVHQLRGRVDAILVGRRTAEADDPLLTARTASPPPRKAVRVIVDSRLQLSLDSRLVNTAENFRTLIACGPQASKAKADQLRRCGCQVMVFEPADRNQRLDQLLLHLAQDYSATNILVEGGGELLGSLYDARQIDQCEVFVAPKLIGGREAPGPLAGIGAPRLSQTPTVVSQTMIPSEDDWHLSLRLDWQPVPNPGP